MGQIHQWHSSKSWRKGERRRRSRVQEEQTLSKHILGTYKKKYLAMLSKVGFTEIHYEAFSFLVEFRLVKL